MTGKLWALAVLLLLTASVSPVQAFGLLAFTAEEKAAILRHGPWPMPAPDAVPLAAGRLDAAQALGQSLFFDTRLVPTRQVACGTCHQPGLAFTDGLARARGLAEGVRNSPSLWNSVHQRWQGWDGGADSLWAQAIRALLDPREMGSSASHVRRTLVQEPDLACRYAQAFGRHPVHSNDEQALVHAAQALGAFVATLISPRSEFDRFRDALASGDRVKAARYPLQAQQGLRIFVGKGQCNLCHLGPMFSNGEFADIGLPFFSRPGVVDSGRYGGIEALKASPYTRTSAWAGATDTTTTRHVELLPRNFGEFKVPGLRLAAQTAPYMHDGQLKTLADVVRHYDEMNLERLHSDGEQILRPLRLNPAEREQLLAFLRTLSSPAAARWRPSMAGPSNKSCASSAATQRSR